MKLTPVTEVMTPKIIISLIKLFQKIKTKLKWLLSKHKKHKVNQF
jgi:hypothetical protein